MFRHKTKGFKAQGYAFLSHCTRLGRRESIHQHYLPTISSSFNTVRQFRAVLTVFNFESK